MLSLPVNSHATWGDICIFQLCLVQHKEELGIEGSTFDGAWVTRRWWDVCGAAENEGWAVSVAEDGKLGVHGGITVNRSGSGMLDGGWNLSWDDGGVLDEEDTEVGDVISLLGLVDDV